MGFCQRCGLSDGSGIHACTVSMPELEPPRFCAECGRRMVVQVTPRSWTARCIEHGELRG